LGLRLGTRLARQTVTATRRHEIELLSRDKRLVGILRDGDLAAIFLADDDLQAIAPVHMAGYALCENGGNRPRHCACEVSTIATANDTGTEKATHNSPNNTRDAAIGGHVAIAIDDRDLADTDDGDDFHGAGAQSFRTAIGIRRRLLGSAASENDAAKEKRSNALEHDGLNEKMANMPTGRKARGGRRKLSGYTTGSVDAYETRKVHEYYQNRGGHGNEDSIHTSSQHQLSPIRKSSTELPSMTC